MNRRKMLIGLGTAGVGTGALFGSGAFTQVQADRDVTIGVDADSDALLGLEANEAVASVVEDPDTGELVIDTDRLSDGDEGFNVGSTVQIGRTIDATFGTVVSDSDFAFKLVNNFSADDGEGATDESADGFTGVLDVAIDLTEFTPDDNDATVEFVTTRDDGGPDLEDSATVTGGERLVFDAVEPAEEIYVAIRIETDSPGADPDELDGDVVFQAGSDMADEFPTEERPQDVGQGEVLNQDTGARLSLPEFDQPVAAAIDDAGPDDTLLVGPGEYDAGTADARFEITTPGLTLQSVAGPDETTLGGNLRQVAASADDITIRGFSAGAIAAFANDADESPVSNSVSGVLIENNNAFVEVDAVGGSISDLTIMNNETVPFVALVDMSFSASQFGELTNIHVAGNDATGAGQIEYATRDGSQITDVTIANNTITTEGDVPDPVNLVFDRGTADDNVISDVEITNNDISIQDPPGEGQFLVADENVPEEADEPVVFPAGLDGIVLANEFDPNPDPDPDENSIDAVFPGD